VTDPKNARDTEHGRYYTRPGDGQQLVSVTNVLSTGFSKFGLPKWYANNAADYALDNLPRVVVESRTNRDEVRKEISEAGDRARDGAADLGTRVHALAEAHVTGQQLAEREGDNEAGLYVNQYLKFLDDFGIDIGRDFISAELTVADPARGYAGTLDAICRLGLDGYIVGEPVKPVPEAERVPWLWDIKTSRKRAATQTYPDHALQLASLRHAREMWLPDDTVEPMFRGIVGAAVLNLRPRSYALIPLPTRPDRELAAFHHILGSCQWLHANWPGDYDYRPVKPDGKFKPKRTTKKKEEAA
jgi:hypothetical protein